MASFVTGTMGGGKSAYIIKHLEQTSGWSSYAFGTDTISSRNGKRISRVNISSLTQVDTRKNFVIDEIQFADSQELSFFLSGMRRKKVEFMVAGLTRNLNGKIFEAIKVVHQCPGIEIIEIPTVCDFCPGEGFTNFLRRFPSNCRIHRSLLVEKTQYCTLCADCRRKLPKLFAHTDQESEVETISVMDKVTNYLSLS